MTECVEFKPPNPPEGGLNIFLYIDVDIFFKSPFGGFRGLLKLEQNVSNNFNSEI